MSLQDDYSRLIAILRDGPVYGMSIDEIQAETERGEPWSRRTINDLLCGLGSRVTHEAVRVKHKKITRYTIKESF